MIYTCRVHTKKNRQHYCFKEVRVISSVHNSLFSTQFLAAASIMKSRHISQTCQSHWHWLIVCYRTEARCMHGQKIHAIHYSPPIPSQSQILRHLMHRYPDQSWLLQMELKTWSEFNFSFWFGHAYVVTHKVEEDECLSVLSNIVTLTEKIRRGVTCSQQSFRCCLDK
jgi:hypothetical protein